MIWRNKFIRIHNSWQRILRNKWNSKPKTKRLANLKSLIIAFRDLIRDCVKADAGKAIKTREQILKKLKTIETEKSEIEDQRDIMKLIFRKFDGMNDALGPKSSI